MRPYYTRTIADHIVISDDIVRREDQCGRDFMNKEVARLNEFLSGNSIGRFSWSSITRSQRCVEYYLDITIDSSEY